jgi:hypothetical protein
VTDAADRSAHDIVQRTERVRMSGVSNMTLRNRTTRPPPTREHPTTVGCAADSAGTRCAGPRRPLAHLTARDSLKRPDASHRSLDDTTDRRGLPVGRGAGRGQRYHGTRVARAFHLLQPCSTFVLQVPCSARRG